VGRARAGASPGAGRLTPERRSASGPAKAGRPGRRGDARAKGRRALPGVLARPASRLRNGLGRKPTFSGVRSDPPERTRFQVDVQPRPFRIPERTRLDSSVERSPFRIPARTRLEVDIRPSPCRIPERTPLDPRVNASPFRIRRRGLALRSRGLHLAGLGRPGGALLPGASRALPARGRSRDPPRGSERAFRSRVSPPSWPALAGPEALLLPGASRPAPRTRVCSRAAPRTVPGELPDSRLLARRPANRARRARGPSPARSPEGGVTARSRERNDAPLRKAEWRGARRAPRHAAGPRCDPGEAPSLTSPTDSPSGDG